MVRLVLIGLGLALAAPLGLGGCRRDHPCAEDSDAPARLAAQAQCESDLAATSTFETGEEPPSAGVPCSSRADCCPDPDTCSQKCVYIGTQRLCYDSIPDQSIGLGVPCDRFEDQQYDTCDSIYACIPRLDANGGDNDEGYCKPLCAADGTCPPLYGCQINGLCRSACDPLDDQCKDGEGCRWIAKGGEGLFDCQPIAPEGDPSGGCDVQEPDQPGTCPPGSMCVGEKSIGGAVQWRCAAFCGDGVGCSGGKSCTPFPQLVPESRVVELDPDTETFVEEVLGLCSE